MPRNSRRRSNSSHSSHSSDSDCCHEKKRSRCKSYDPCNSNRSCNDRCKTSCKTSCSTNYTITTPLKAGHPWEHHITETDRAFSVTYPSCKTVKGGTIRVKRGKKYTFTFNQTSQTQPFQFLLFFTTDPTGGKAGGKVPGDVDPVNYNPIPIPTTPAPFGSGSQSFTVTNNFPKIFYYQDRNNQFMGGLIIVEDDR